MKQQLNIDIRLITLEDKNLEDWKGLTGTSDDEALLIRPDDFVAAKLTPGNLLRVMKSIMGR